ncbi:amino acid transporter AVT1J-like isoform X1 [Nicotiana sylvestris]|uniref:Vacuolar amino acid transporter 1-like isoform X1 n=1 Tax=Nicotiana sylvestris TaxID=4096 RepID=A0A1U7W8U0_NICSY|nr:PREDICTED: vacuolar amino acid transporter 1-like isoform X1 [Nicotiana sylvestris]
MEPKSEDDYSNIRVRLLVANDNYYKQNKGSSEETRLEDPQLQHEFVSGPTSFSRTCFNGLNALSGVGILSVPSALASGGWLSLIFLFIIAISTYYTSLLIQRCMDIDPTITSYPDIGKRAFGKCGRMLVSATMYVELYMVVTGFLILESDNLQNLFGDIEFQIFGVTIGGKQSFVVIISLIILTTVWLNNMSILSYISASGVVASIVLLGSIFWAAMFDGLGFQANGTQFINWKGMPTAVSLYAFCYCAHPVFPTLYTSMINPKKFSKVMLVCFLLCTISYASMAIVGYLMFGPTVLSQITLNLPTNKISSKVAIYTTLVNPIAKYGLMIKPLVISFENQLPVNSNKRVFSILIRTALVISTIIVALAIPFFGYLMSLVGAFLSITASIILPCLCFLRISGIYRTLGFELVVIVGIVIMGIAIMIVGTYTSVVEIIGHL